MLINISIYTHLTLIYIRQMAEKKQTRLADALAKRVRWVYTEKLSYKPEFVWYIAYLIYVILDRLYRSLYCDYFFRRYFLK